MTLAPRRLCHVALAICLELSCLVALALPGTAHAQGHPAVSDAAPAQIEALIRTLDDAEAREGLKRQLQLLLEAQRPGPPAARPDAVAQIADAVTAAPTAAAPAAESVGAQMLATLSDHVEKVSTALVNLVEAVADLPQRARQMALLLADPQRRAFWTDTAVDLAAVLGAAFLAGWMTRRLLAGPRRRLDARRSDRIAIRLLLVPVRFIAETLPIVAFGLVGYVALPFFEPNQATRLIALAVINAQIAVAAVAALGAAILAPSAPGLRPCRMSDETAAYLQVWTRRLAVAAIYGFAITELAGLLGLDPTLRGILLRAFGLAVGAMAIVIVLQNRLAIARWIGGAAPAGAPVPGQRSPDEGESDFPPVDTLSTPVAVSRLAAFRRQAARFWHVLAIAYIVAAYAVWSLQIAGGFAYLLRATALTAILAVIVRLADTGLRRVFDRSFALSDELRVMLPGLEARANRYLPLVRQSILIVLHVSAGLALLQVWGLDVFGWLSDGTGRKVAIGVVKIGIILALALLLSEVVGATIEHYLREVGPDGHAVHRSGRARTLLPLLRNVFRLTIGILVTLVTLSEIGIDIAPLLAAAGVVGLAVGFGAQTLIKDIITGVFILIEDTIAIGDAVDLGGHAGTVEAMTIRTIRLRDGDGTVHTVPFSAVSSIMNLTRDFSNAIFDINVAYDADVDQVIKIVKEVGDGMREDPGLRHLILQPIEVLGLDSMQNGAMVIKAQMRTRPSGKGNVVRAFNLRLKRAFDARGIAMPFPQRMVQVMPAAPASEADAGMAAPTLPPARTATRR